MKKFLILALILGLCGSLFAKGAGQAGGAAGGGGGGGQMIQGANVPRNQTIILENPGGRANPADYFNRWSGWNTSYMGGLQQLGCDSLWYIDPDAGINGAWENALASEPPTYNSTFTEMSVKLRQGIYWSDGVQFTADDVIYTIETLKKNDGMYRTSTFRTYVDRVEKINDFAFKVYLKIPNSRFHSNFTVRWDATFIMPKHIFEKAADVKTFKFNPPVTLGPYTLKDYDPQGYWYLWEKRPDWQRTTLALMGSLENAPKYAMYVDGGTSDVKVMSMRNHQIDVIHDMAVEGAMTLKRTVPTVTTWFPDFPWGHPDPTLVSCVLNCDKPGLNNKDVRWALALALDINRIAMASYRGAMTISAIALPPTGNYPKYYHLPMEQWLKDYTLDLGDGTTYKPYNPNASIEIADAARKIHGSAVPSNPDEIRKFLGAGWWKYDKAAAEKLMIKGGMKRNAQGIWQFANGQPFKMAFIGQTDSEPSQNRGAAMVVELWKEFGIDISLTVTSSFNDYTLPGNFDGVFFWNIETWGGHPDLSNFLTAFHSSEYVPIGQRAGRNWSRWRNPKLDANITESLKYGMDDPKIVELGKEFVKIATDDMFQIPISSYNVFTMMDTYYWTGFPSINNPYTDPVPNWTNSRYMYVKLRSTGKN